MAADAEDRIPIRLTGLSGVLRAEGYTPVDYLLMRDAAINGRIPAHQRNTIWHFYREDAAAIATGLRLARTQTVAA
jgi:hypothetical protein